MKIGIHFKPGSFSERWIAYCQKKSIEYKLVNCYANDIIKQLKDCDALMWHFHHASPKDIKFAKQLLFSVQASGKKVFPDFNTVWHFDDKVGQKYLLEAFGAPLVQTSVFFSKQEALEWAKETTWPKVFKLRGGAGSQNVKLVKTKRQAAKIIRKAFGKGFKQYNAWGSLKERWRMYSLGQVGIKNVIKGLVRFFHPPVFAKLAGREKGYAYFQEFVPKADHDLRIIVIDEKALAIKRMVRPKDFRASGSGLLKFDPEIFPKPVLKTAFSLASELKMQSMAADFIVINNTFFLIEVSYGFPQKNFADNCPGYWDKDLNWHKGPFDPYGWMVEGILRDKR